MFLLMAKFALNVSHSSSTFEVDLNLNLSCIIERMRKKSCEKVDDDAMVDFKKTYNLSSNFPDTKRKLRKS